jgi:hypothetical protein
MELELSIEYQMPMTINVHKVETSKTAQISSFGNG